MPSKSSPVLPRAISQPTMERKDILIAEVGIPGSDDKMRLRATRELLPYRSDSQLKLLAETGGAELKLEEVTIGNQRFARLVFSSGDGIEWRSPDVANGTKAVIQDGKLMIEGPAGPKDALVGVDLAGARINHVLVRGDGFLVAYRKDWLPLWAVAPMGRSPKEAEIDRRANDIKTRLERDVADARDRAKIELACIDADKSRVSSLVRHRGGKIHATLDADDQFEADLNVVGCYACNKKGYVFSVGNESAKILLEQDAKAEMALDANLKPNPYAGKDLNDYKRYRARRDLFLVTTKWWPVLPNAPAGKGAYSFPTAAESDDFLRYGHVVLAGHNHRKRDLRITRVGDLRFLDCLENAKVALEAFRRCRGVVVYIHGFNNTAQGAVNTMASFVECRCLDEYIPVVFAWESEFTSVLMPWTNYPRASENSRHVLPRAKECMKLLKRWTDSHGMELHAFAHSMGCRILLDLVIAGETIPNTVAFVAPDVSEDLFVKDLADVHARLQSSTTVPPILVMGTYSDLALIVSGSLINDGLGGTRHRRLGRGKHTVCRGIRYVDVKNPAKDVLGHSYFGTDAPRMVLHQWITGGFNMRGIDKHLEADLVEQMEARDDVLDYRAYVLKAHAEGCDIRQ
ncbi:hypothetical protein DFJ74DRAFT_698005 [Hyaloraphidium curvatum]|nr:hypothetical protein DFJ74DRAFT_698005 [Hyaloraphidium curvatum]